MGKRDVIKRRKQQQDSKNTLTIIFIIAAFAIVAVAMVLLTQFKPAAEVIIPDRELALQRDGLTMGNPEADVKVIEFADYQCPGCANYWEVLEPTIIENYVNTGKVHFTYSPFSFVGSGYDWDESTQAAMASYCANDQQKFWEYRDLIFANHNGENLGTYTRKVLISYANELGMDEDAFTECLDSQKYLQQVSDDNSYADAQGVTYTPSFIVNGRIVSASELVQTIENELAQ